MRVASCLRLLENARSVRLSRRLPAIADAQASVVSARTTRLGSPAPQRQVHAAQVKVVAARQLHEAERRADRPQAHRSGATRRRECRAPAARGIRFRAARAPSGGRRARQKRRPRCGRAGRRFCGSSESSTCGSLDPGSPRESTARPRGVPARWRYPALASCSASRYAVAASRPRPALASASPRRVYHLDRCAELVHFEQQTVVLRGALECSASSAASAASAA